MQRIATLHDIYGSESVLGFACWMATGAAVTTQIEVGRVKEQRRASLAAKEAAEEALEKEETDLVRCVESMKVHERIRSFRFPDPVAQ